MIWIKASAKWINVNVIDTICSSPDWNQFISLFYFDLCPFIYTCSFLCFLKCVLSKNLFIYIYHYYFMYYFIHFSSFIFLYNCKYLHILYSILVWTIKVNENHIDKNMQINNKLKDIMKQQYLFIFFEFKTIRFQFNKRSATYCLP